MATITQFAEIAALAGDPARAQMLHALMDGRALSATELAAVGGVTAQTASGHLGRLTEAGLLTVERQGRHRYHRIADRAVAGMIESIMSVAATRVAPPPVRTGPRDLALRTARTCYDHLAGRLCVALTDALTTGGYAEIASDAGLITTRGTAFFAALGIALPEPSKRARVLCRPCLDWSERRPHLAGAVGAALCTHCLAAGWLRRQEGIRALTITPAGEIAFRQHFGLDAFELRTPSAPLFLATL